VREVVVSIYSTGVDAYRDTTKWLAAFVPAVSLATAILVAGPRLLRTVETAPSVGSWLESYWLTLICGVALFGGMAAILATGAKVLSVEPADIADLATATGGKEALAKAIGSGVTAPDFLDKQDFDQAMARLQVTAGAGEIPLDDPTMARLKPAIAALREWSVFSQMKDPFKKFRVTFIMSTVAISLAVLLAPAQLGSSEAINKPTTVEVEVDAAGAADLNNSTGCSDPGTTTFYAVAGTWDHPELRTDGPGCRFASTWLPSPDQLELRIPASSAK
jgi:hypothetical protein